jgi:L-arabinose isomerase
MLKLKTYKTFYKIAKKKNKNQNNKNQIEKNIYEKLGLKDKIEKIK